MDKQRRKRVKDTVIWATSENGKINERLVLFFDLYLDGMDIKEAWVEAGYSPSTKQQAMMKIRQHWKVIEKMIMERIGGHVPMALSVVVGLAQSAKSETVRLNAAKDLLARAGMDKPTEIIHRDKDTEDLPDDQLQKEIKYLLKEVDIDTENTTILEYENEG